MKIHSVFNSYAIMSFQKQASLVYNVPPQLCCWFMFTHIQKLSRYRCINHGSTINHGSQNRVLNQQPITLHHIPVYLCVAGYIQVRDSGNTTPLRLPAAHFLRSSRFRSRFRCSFWCFVLSGTEGWEAEPRGQECKQ